MKRKVIKVKGGYLEQPNPLLRIVLIVVVRL